MDSTVMIRLAGGGGGSGIVIDSKTILTCYHVVKGQKIVMVYQHGVVRTGQVTKIDPKRDLAIVTLSLPLSTKGTQLSTQKITVGSKVISAGHPFLKPLYLTYGAVGSIDKNYIIHDSAVNGGNSGGGLYDSNGDLVAMNAMIMTGDGLWCGISIGIRVEILKDFLSKEK